LAALVSSELAGLLNSIEYSSVGVVNLGYDSEVVPKYVRGFGYLIPPQEKQKILGVTFDSYCFPEQNFSEKENRLTVMIGGDFGLNVRKLTSTNIEEIALKELEKHLGIHQVPKVVSVKACLNSIPQKFVGHSTLVDKIDIMSKQLYGKRLTILGNYLASGVGINDCITASQKMVNELEL